MVCSVDKSNPTFFRPQVVTNMACTSVSVEPDRSELPMEECPEIVLFEFLMSQQNHKGIQGMIKNLLEIDKSYDSLEGHYQKSLHLLHCVLSQQKDEAIYSDEAISILITICAQALDDSNKTKSNSSLREQYMDNVKSICFSFGKYSKEVIQTLFKKCVDDLGVKQYLEALKLLCNALGDTFTQSLSKVYAHEAQGGVVGYAQDIKDNPIKKYSKNLMAFQLALLQKNGPAIRALGEICIDERFTDQCFIDGYTYGFNAKGNVSAEDMAECSRKLAIKEQYKKDLELLEFVKSKQYHAMLPTLIENNTDISGRSMLHIAAAQGDLETVETLLKQGVGRGLLDKMKMTPLHYAAKMGHYGVVEALLGDNVCEEIDSLTVNKETPLFLAAQAGRAMIVRLLVSKGANIGLANVSGKTPRSIAAKHRLELKEFAYAASRYGQVVWSLETNKANESQQKLAGMKLISQYLQPYAQSLYKYMKEWPAYIKA